MTSLNKTLATATLGGVMVWSAAAQDLVVNGTFETPQGNNAFDAGSTNLPGWTVDTLPPDGVYIGSAGLLAFNNFSQNLELTGNTSATRSTGGGISQTLATTPGGSYFVSIEVASRTGTAAAGNFDFGGTNLALAASSQSFTNLTWVVTASSNSTVIDITGDPNSGSQQMVIDNVYVSLATAPPGIAVEPQSIVDYAGNTARFVVSAGGPPPVSYQWYFNNTTPLATGTNATLVLKNVQGGGTYRLIITNDYGSTTSVVATLSVIPNLVVNGDFEDPYIPYYAAYTPGSAALSGWTIDAAPPDGVQLGRPGLFGNNGSQTLQLTGGANYSTGGGISQTIPTIPGAYYTVSLDMACRESTLTASGKFNFGSSSHALSVRGTTFSNFTWQAVATDTSTVIDVTGDPNSASQQLVLDNVRVFPTLAGPVSASTSTVIATPSSVGVDGSTSTITVRLMDTNGVPVSGKHVSLAKTSGPGTPVITVVTNITSTIGYATFTVQSTTPGTNVFTATDATDGNLVITQTASVNFLAGSVANVGTSTVVAVPPSVVADGSAKSTVTVTLKDAHSNAVQGKTVTLAQTSGPGTAVIATVSGTSDVNGQASFTVASTTAGSDVFTASDVTDGNVDITQTATVTFTVGAVNTNTSTVVASPDVVPADGSDAATITVTLKDATSNGVPNKTVTLAQTSGPGSPVIATVSGTTDTNGAAVFSVTSTTPGVDFFTARDVDDGNLIIAQTAAVTFSSLINWSGLATTVAGDSDVVTNGVLVYAEHWAGVDATVNGVPFTAAQNHVVGSSGGYETLTAATGYPQGSLSTAYWNILRGKWYNAGTGQTVTLNSLQTGHEYLIQIWSSDPRYGPSQEEIIAPGFNLGIKAGQYGVGTFTAAGEAEVLGLGGDGVLNAVQVRDLSSIAITEGPGAGQLTINGYTDLAASVVTLKATALTAPIVWTPIQTNAVPGGNYSFTIPRGTGAVGFFRTMYQ